MQSGYQALTLCGFVRMLYVREFTFHQFEYKWPNINVKGLLIRMSVNYTSDGHYNFDGR